MTRHSRPGRRGVATIILTASALLSTLVPASAGASAKSPAYPRSVAAPPEVRTAATHQLTELLEALTERTSSSDPYYWNGRVLYTTQSVCFRCEAGPAVLAAVTWRATGSTRAGEMARRTFDALIAGHRRSDGSFGPPMGNEGGFDIQTTLFANEVGEAYLMLYPTLSERQRTVWSRAVVSAADWLIANKNLQWYTNGNIVLANALTMLLASKMSGARADYFSARYAEAKRFAIAPPQNRWKGFGFIHSRMPSRADGSDGAGYLAESGGSTPGLDVDYLQMQSNVLAWMYWVSPTNSNLRMLNMEVNLLMENVDRSTWWLQTGGGTRHPSTDRRVGFDTSSMPILATLGGRVDLRRDLKSYTDFMRREWLAAATYSNPGMAYSFGSAAALALYGMTRSS